MKQEIVKVQVSLMSSEEFVQVLVYNEKRTVLYEGDISSEIQKAMKGEVKKFFYAYAKKGGMIELIKPAPWQSW